MPLLCIYEKVECPIRGSRLIPLGWCQNCTHFAGETEHGMADGDTTARVVICTRDAIQGD